MRVKVDGKLCIGCALCTEICSDVFEMNEEGIAVAVQAVPDGKEESVQDAIENCPVGAILEEF